MIEDVCNLILVGEVRNIFSTAEEKKEVLERMEMIDSQRDKNLQVRQLRHFCFTRAGFGVS